MLEGIMTKVIYPAIKNHMNAIFEKNHQILQNDLADGAIVMIRDEKSSAKPNLDMKVLLR